MPACQISCKWHQYWPRPGAVHWHCRYWDEICVRSRKGGAREGVILGPSVNKQPDLPKAAATRFWQVGGKRERERKSASAPPLQLFRQLLHKDCWNSRNPWQTLLANPVYIQREIWHIKFEVGVWLRAQLRKASKSDRIWRFSIHESILLEIFFRNSLILANPRFTIHQ